MLLLLSADLFQNLLFEKILSKTLSTVWIQMRTDRKSVLIWVKTVCKGYQLTTNVAQTHKLNPSEIKFVWGLLKKINILTHCMLGNFSCFCCCLLTSFKIIFFEKILSGTLSECQTVWTQIRTDILSVLIWVQTVCKGYQQTTKASQTHKLNPSQSLRGG